METLQVTSVKDVALQRFWFMKHSSLLHIFLLLKRFGLAMAVFSLCRLIFFAFNAGTFYPLGLLHNTSAFFFGLLFDVSALVYLLSPVIILHILPLPFRSHKIYQLVLKILFVTGLGFGLALNIIDSEYYKFLGKRSGADLFTAQNDIGALWYSYLLDYWFLALLFFLLIFLVIKLYPDFKSNKTAIKNYTLRSYFLQTVYMVLLAGIAFLGARGGIGLRPIRPFDAARFVQPALVPLALNTPFQVIGTMQGRYVGTPDYMPLAEAEKILPLQQQYKNGGAFSKKNVVIIILESFGKEYVGYFNNGKGYTPFLDSLCQQSLLFTHAYATGKRSSDAVPAILAGIPSLLDVPYINSNYSDTRAHTLGYYLQQTGYYSAFFHGARNGSMGFDNFLHLAGNGEYFGLSEYPDNKDFDGNWGIYDEPYLEYFAKTLNTNKQPFCATAFTLSSHHPYPIPPQYKNRFPKGTLPIHRAVRYADFSLEQFFIYASRQKWFRNTLFVITADHSAENETTLYQ
ncbi:MAG: LTA synthase family protein, partial [Bacteroidia bacterium]